MDATKCVEEKDNTKSISLVDALYDVTDTIFSFLNIKDLCRAAAVCKNWYTEANKEKARRNTIHALIVEVEDLEDDDYCCEDFPPKYLQNKWHLSEGLRSIPFVLLLFFDGELMDYYPNPSNVYHTNYCYQLDKQCNGVASMAVLGVSLDYTELFGRTNLGAALSIPSTSALEVKTFVPNDEVIFKNAEEYTLRCLAEQDACKFVSSKNDHNCYIYFCNRGFQELIDGEVQHYFLEFTNWIYKLSKPGTYSLWGAEIDQITTNIDGYNTKEEPWAVAIRLSGPAMQSFSIVLKTNLSISEAKDKLLNFKKGMQLKSNTVALAIVPSDKNESSEQRLAKIEILKQVFPEIPLLSVYIKDEFRQLGINSMDCNPQPVTWHRNSISYLVITTK